MALFTYPKTTNKTALEDITIQLLLQRFFGLVRQSCGANTHPEPRVFAQLFRLLSIYSLVKPLKGSNITGGEMLTTLLSLNDLKNKSCEERKHELSIKLDNIILNGKKTKTIILIIVIRAILVTSKQSLTFKLLHFFQGKIWMTFQSLWPM